MGHEGRFWNDSNSLKLIQALELYGRDINLLTCFFADELTHRQINAKLQTLRQRLGKDIYKQLYPYKRETGKYHRACRYFNDTKSLKDARYLR